MADANGIGQEPNKLTLQKQLSQNDAQLQGKPNSSTLYPAIMSAADAKRPRDERLLKLILANLGVTAYQERVPLMLMDFAYRYTSSTLQDALHLTSEGYGTQASSTVKAAANNDMNAVSLSSVRLSIASRTHYQFSPTLGKDFYHELAQERNQVQLPPVGKHFGTRLPPEQYCLTGVGWKLKEEWASLATNQDEEDEAAVDQMMMDREEDDEENGAEDGNERMEDFFGEDVNNNDNKNEMDEG
ncbi:MAG: hypothetical protein Q9184_001133 [Pyrenodesmia sp. 2 TL-2023]